MVWVSVNRLSESALPWPEAYLHPAGPLRRDPVTVQCCRDSVHKSRPRAVPNPPGGAATKRKAGGPTRPTRFRVGVAPLLSTLRLKTRIRMGTCILHSAARPKANDVPSRMPRKTIFILPFPAEKMMACFVH